MAKRNPLPLVTVADGHEHACRLLDDLPRNMSATCIRLHERHGKPQSAKLRQAIEKLYRTGAEDAKRGFFAVMEDYIAHCVECSDVGDSFRLITAEVRGELFVVGEAGHA